MSIIEDDGHDDDKDDDDDDDDDDKDDDDEDNDSSSSDNDGNSSRISDNHTNLPPFHNMRCLRQSKMQYGKVAFCLCRQMVHPRTEPK